MEISSDSASTLRFGEFEVERRSGELRKNGVKIKLQEQPFQILALLLEHPGELVTREQLRKKLWPGGIFVDFENGLNIAIKKLRHALGDDAEVPAFIETLPRRGYRFIATVIPDEPHRVPESDSSTHHISVIEQNAAERGAPMTSPRMRRLGLAFAIVAIVLAVWGLAGLRGWLPGAGEAGQIRSIAVLPLQNLSGDSSQEYFADGMTEELITDLAQIGALRVISRTSSMSYKRTRKTMPEIGRELNVDAVVEGAVVRSGNRVRITAQLVEAAKDRHLWASSYEQDIRDVLGVQDQVARDIADEIRIQLTPHERGRLARVQKVDPRAYEATLKGRYYAHKLTEDGLRKGADYFRQAVAVDPNYAPAYAGLAYYYLAQAGWALPPLDAMPRARDAARRAIRLDGTLAEAHADLGGIHFWFDWDWTAAEQEFKRAVALNPGDATAHELYGACLAWAGRPDAGIAEGKRALAMDPVSVEASRFLGETYYFARRYADAVAQLRETVGMDPNYWFAHLSLGRAYLQIGKIREAIFELELANRLAPDIPEALSALGYAYAISGRKDRAQEIVEQLRQRARQRYIAPYDLAIVYAGLGDKERALESLEQEYRERSIFVTWLRTDPVLDKLRSTAGFRSLLRRASGAWALHGGDGKPL